MPLHLALLALLCAPPGTLTTDGETSCLILASALPAGISVERAVLGTGVVMVKRADGVTEIRSTVEQMYSPFLVYASIDAHHQPSPVEYCFNVTRKPIAAYANGVKLAESEWEWVGVSTACNGLGMMRIPAPVSGRVSIMTENRAMLLK